MYLCNKSGKICKKAEPMKTSRFRKKNVYMKKAIYNGASRNIASHVCQRNVLCWQTQRQRLEFNHVMLPIRFKPRFHVWGRKVPQRQKETVRNRFLEKNLYKLRTNSLRRLQVFLPEVPAAYNPYKEQRDGKRFGNLHKDN